MSTDPREKTGKKAEQLHKTEQETKKTVVLISMASGGIPELIQFMATARINVSTIAHLPRRMERDADGDVGLRCSQAAINELPWCDESFAMSSFQARLQVEPSCFDCLARQTAVAAPLEVKRWKSTLSRQRVVNRAIKTEASGHLFHGYVPSKEFYFILTIRFFLHV
ncbi:hypothetical protein MUK42_32544 [Musa troglodytarum]|uniref:Uncharacterized protein n=1 Tax=Musa troglodytarum TaxID=320322 RepID=A0A9E7H9M7_9LILI|nr:hypothetical protein MUK42_32544 [Musa troglodytarum]